MSYWKLYFNRTSQILREKTVRVLLMQGTEEPSHISRTLFKFNTRADIQQFATGCDSDIGGTSTVNFDLDESPENNAGIGSRATAKFWGDMRLEVKAGLEGKVRGGYAGFRNKLRPTFFGDITEDVSNHQYLALRLRVSGDPCTHNSYFANIQTNEPDSTDLWQHRLYFKHHDNTWEDIFIPFDNFVRTNFGELSEEQIEMNQEKVRSVGISLLGGNSGAAGKYELGIDSIRIINEDDMTPATTDDRLAPPTKYKTP